MVALFTENPRRSILENQASAKSHSRKLGFQDHNARNLNYSGTSLSN